ncbi:11461_t:CDS:2 [Funneliformis caledonium]|uniref:11461_t:CDS:1 n=1 Tax=Funneliformis caledonium TaxID=1117310 RepID=A0A9N9I9Z6_9GLOM|nr:11461_t:CDS:2 [Funneliformis caledonium]
MSETNTPTSTSTSPLLLEMTRTKGLVKLEKEDVNWSVQGEKAEVVLLIPQFERCTSLTLKVKNYGSLLVDSLETMRNEYVVAILHSALHIVRDETKKEFSMRQSSSIEFTEDALDENIMRCVIA